MHMDVVISTDTHEVIFIFDPVRLYGEGKQNEVIHMDAKYLSHLLTDRFVMKIIMGTYKKPMSVQEIAKYFDIPMMKAYYLVRKLEDQGIMKVEREMVLPGGHTRRFYRSKLKSVSIAIKDGKLKFDVEMDSGPKDNTYEEDILNRTEVVRATRC